MLRLYAGLSHTVMLLDPWCLSWDTQAQMYCGACVPLGAILDTGLSQERGTQPEVLSVLETFTERTLPSTTSIDVSHADLMQHLRDGIG